MAEAMLELIANRRVVRVMTDEPVAREDLERILNAGRWAPTGGNTRSVRFVAVEDPTTLRLLRMVSPGMLQRPAAAIVLCLDADVAEAEGVSPTDPTPEYDIGTTMQTMLLAAHALGLGAGPVSSCSWAAVAVVLSLPPKLLPGMIVCLGHAAPPAEQMPMRAPKVTWRDLTHWERYEVAEGGPSG
jgi:nitroreductase